KKNKNPASCGLFGDKHKRAGPDKKDCLKMIIQDNHTIEIFKNQLPVKPYCSNNLQSGLSIRNKNRALEMLYLQANQPAIQTCLLFDLDEDNAFYKFDEVGLPVPTFITKSPDSGRCHYGYMLKAGVCKTQHAKLKPLKYAAAVEAGIAGKLASDRGYAGLITKNPLHEHWSPYWSGADLYELDYLADFVELETPKKAKKSENYGLGRNVNLFEDLRTYAYRRVLKFKKDSTYEAWERDVLAEGLNNHCNVLNPLQYNEIKATARSVSRWTWKHFDSATFSEIQTNRAKRPRKTSAKNEMLEILMSKGAL
ncbi:replication initiation protein, partial [Salmonella enterica subsp. enterica serovar Bareilly]